MSYRHCAARTAIYFPTKNIFKRMFSTPMMMAALEDFKMNTQSAAGNAMHERYMEEAWHGSILHDTLHAEEAESSADESGEDELAMETSQDSDDAHSEVEAEGTSDLDSEDEDEEDDGELAQADSDPEEAPSLQVLPPESEHIIYISVTADGTEIQKNVSFTPVTSKVLNLGCSLRSLMSNIRLHAVFPPSVKDYNALFAPFADELHTHRPGGGNPIRLRHPVTRKRIHLYVHLAYFVNDIRGQPAVSGGKSAPCINGSCAMCKVASYY